MTAHACIIFGNLYGRFTVITERGEDLTPRGAKSKALLALVMTEANFGRNRIWLQDRLWSDRGPEHSAGSLRQALSEIRRSLGAHAHVLKADRQTVCLDPKWVQIRESRDGEFLEGLDIRDNEFEDWLRTERSRRDQTAAQPLRSEVYPRPQAMLDRRIILQLSPLTDRRIDLFARVFSGYVLRTLRENLMITADVSAQDAFPPGTLLIRTDFLPDGDRSFALTSSVEEVGGRGILWSDVRTAIPKEADPTADSRITAIVYRLCEAVSDAALGHVLNVPFDRDANLLANLAVRKMFTIDPEEIDGAAQLLEQAYQIEPRGVFLAWRAQLNVIRYVERFEKDGQMLRDETDELSAKALAADPTNSNVLAAVANVHMQLNGDYLSGNELAAISVRANASNPLAWQTLSNARLQAQDHASGYAAAVHAQKLADGTRLKFWCDFQRAMSAAIIGNPEEALKFCSSASALAPNFRPALRYLTVFSAAAGKVDTARRAIRRLARCETDFRLERLIDDPDYPVGTMRRAGLLDRAKLADLE